MRPLSFIALPERRGEEEGGGEIEQEQDREKGGGWVYRGCCKHEDDLVLNEERSGNIESLHQDSQSMKRDRGGHGRYAERREGRSDSPPGEHCRGC
jgi:hypothetical protein